LARLLGLRVAGKKVAPRSRNVAKGRRFAVGTLIAERPRTDPDEPDSVPPTFNMEKFPLTLNGVGIDYRQYSNALVSRVIREHSLTVPSRTMDDGIHMFDVEKEFPMALDVPMVGGYAVQSIRIKLKYPFEVIRARVISKFNVETRGRSHVFEGVPIGAFGMQQVTIVERDNGPPAFIVNVGPPTGAPTRPCEPTAKGLEARIAVSATTSAPE
jgi:hypothetical protein